MAMPNETCFVGIDTSNYTTSVAVCSAEGKILLNYKLPLSVKNGERGLRQSDAVYAHIKNQPTAMSVLSLFLREHDLYPSAVGYSVSPVNAEDSFMPCFMCGKAFALSFVASDGLPVYPFSHQEGHIAAASYSAVGDLSLLRAPLMAFHVSGGTTDIVSCKPEKTRLITERIGGSSDLHAGQLIDRVGVLMGHAFPCGPALEKEASLYCGKPLKPSVSVNGLICNLSGGENTAKKMFLEQGSSAAARYTLDFIARTLDKLSENLRAVDSCSPILYSGGVMSNGYIKSILSCREGTYFAAPEFSSDNGAGIALLARERFFALGRI